ncbi:MAG: GNAT family N-acetyltransferase [Rhodovulum sulfidophilum]|uniref:GNAT family N-acetyltransferase n=1 Tax=Rhodovulum sulfidophilum TaxID=35806 RepID=A0A2W5NFZ1_RHOSU|nr:MAG: GNAT family N-acetyltransferase [Rhodovulum sulfidophilum]
MITTARLVLRAFAEADRDAFRALVADPLVAGDARRVIPREDADALFDFYRACWDEDGVAYAAIERRTDGAFLGMSGLALCRREPPEPPLCEIGWAIGPAHRGQGFATEAAAAWIDHGFEVLRLPRIHALTWADNVPSLRLIRTLGFLPDAGFAHPDGEARAERRAFALTPALWHGRLAGLGAERRG